MTTARAATLGELAAAYSAARLRTIEVALDLFARHGVGGTSLQMIADELGVTKAAVYHQFRAKDEIAVAVLEVALSPIEELLDQVERAGGMAPGEERSDLLLCGLIDHVVANRRTLATLQSDPVLFDLLGQYPPSVAMWARIFATLVPDADGPDLGPRARVRISMLAAALGSTAFPLVMDLEDEVLRDELVVLARRILAPGS